MGGEHLEGRSAVYDLPNGNCVVMAHKTTPPDWSLVKRLGGSIAAMLRHGLRGCMDFACKNVEGACQQASLLVIIAEPKPFLCKRVKGGFQQMPWEKVTQPWKKLTQPWKLSSTASVSGGVAEG